MDLYDRQLATTNVGQIPLADGGLHGLQRKITDTAKNRQGNRAITHQAQNITAAFDPPLVSSLDRVPRVAEVHEKQWAVMDMGVLTLKKGKTQLRVRAKQIAGKKVMELKGVVIRRVE